MTMVQTRPVKAYRGQTKRDALTLAARSNPTAFACLTMKGYTPAPFHWLIGNALRDIADGKMDRLMISMPPRHGKSELVTVRFPGWYLGRNPDHRIISASYGAELAEDFGRKARAVIASDLYTRIFPGVGISRTSSAAGRWDIDGHAGGYIAAGVGGPITGKGANVLLIDDPVKNREEADSQTYRDLVWDWYTSTAYPRLEKPGAIVLVSTRWHEDDLAGRLLRAENDGGDRWHVITLPAINDSTGAALWPEKYNRDDLERIRRVTGTRDWAALYQQVPAPQEGNIFRRHFWRYWADPRRVGLLNPVRLKTADGREISQHPVPRPDIHEFDEIIQSWDMAFKDTKSSAFVVGQVWGKLGADRFLLTQIRGKWDFPQTIKHISALSRTWPEARIKLVEDKANGSAVISSLRSVLGGFVAVEPKGGKESRARAVSQVVEGGNVFIPHPAQAAWVDGFINECGTFPAGTYADQVDSMTQALTRWLANIEYATIDRTSFRRITQKYSAGWKPFGQGRNK